MVLAATLVLIKKKEADKGVCLCVCVCLRERGRNRMHARVRVYMCLTSLRAGSTSAHGPETVHASTSDLLKSPR